MAKVLVTGANGFLGSWLTRQLVKEGHEVSVLVRKNSDLSELSGISCHYLYGDITDPPSLDLAFQGIDSVFHLAGLIAYKKADREKMDLVNVTGTKNVIQSCHKLKIRRLVHLSSVVAVGAGFTSDQILNENSEYNIGHLNLGYFETKRNAELLVKEAVRLKQIDAVILNPSTIYGPGDAKKGSRKSQLKVAQGRFPFYTAGGVNVVAVEDVVAAIISAWKKGRSGERYILAGENILIKDLFVKIAKAAGQPAPKILMPKWLLLVLGKSCDIFSPLAKKLSLSQEQAYTTTLYHWFDAGKAKSELDFKPTSADIAIEKSVQWMKENNLLSKPNPSKL